MFYPYFFSSYSFIFCDNQSVIKFVSVLFSLYAITSNLKRISGVILSVKFSVFFVKIPPPHHLIIPLFATHFHIILMLCSAFISRGVLFNLFYSCYQFALGFFKQMCIHLHCCCNICMPNHISNQGHWHIIICQ